MRDKIFDISFEYDGRKYTGWVNPSEKTDESGKPASFHVVLDNVSFGYLSLNNCKWTINEDRRSSLIEAVGHAIEKNYGL
ncbi:MAG TPA: hypothetical protein VGQ09_00710 [Chitinophagaceae bacterium]|nr:hypothetical protein [Chitinophagaceae bacterium]